ncbi:hypothetical protein, partial [Pseudomonas aeruginosa]
MSQILKTSLLIVGGGPGGYVAAIRAGQLGDRRPVLLGMHPADAETAW